MSDIDPEGVAWLIPLLLAAWAGSRFGAAPEGADFGVGFASVLVYRIGGRVSLTAEFSLERLDGRAAVLDAYTSFRGESHLSTLALGVRVGG